MSFNKPVRLRVQVTDEDLTIIAEPTKGDPDEEEALQVIEYFVRMLVSNAVAHRTFDRNTPIGDRVDMIVIKFRE